MLLRLLLLLLLTLLLTLLQQQRPTPAMGPFVIHILEPLSM
jgi:hypothetical protein